MKKISYAFLMVLILFGTRTLQAQEQLSMTTALNPGDPFTFTLNYGVELDVDWGDGVFTPYVSLGQPITGTLSGQNVLIRAYDISLLDCSGQSLTHLDVGEISSLSVLIASGNELETITLTANKQLVKVNLAFNKLAVVSVAGLTRLKEMVVNNNQLTSLSLTGNRMLESLICNDNQIGTLTLSNQIRLKTLWCQNNKLKSLNLRSNSPLSSLMCQNNELTTLNVTGLKSLTDVWCNNNDFTTLDLSAADELAYLSADNAGIEKLSYGSSENLAALYLNQNSLGYAALLSTDAVENYNYAPQNPLPIPAYLETGQTLDLSAQLTTADGVATQATFRWTDGVNDLVAGVDYDETDGKFIFKRAVAHISGEISSALFPALPKIITSQSVVVAGTGLDQNQADNMLTVATINGKLIIDSRREQAVRIYTIKGELVHSYDRLTGQIELQLPRGIYLVNNHKVAL